MVVLVALAVGMRRHRATRRPAIRLRAIRHPTPRPKVVARAAPAAGSYAAGDKEATTSDDGTYLRGAQMTDSEGIVRFTSIYPGWYVSRTVHIHVKVHIDRKTVLTTQLFFDDTLSDTINADVSPYNEHKNRDTYNDTDKIFTKEGLVKAEYDGTKVLAAINIGIEA